MIRLIPLWFVITDEARIALWNFQRRVWGLNLEIPSFPIDTELIDLKREMSKRPHHPRGVGYRP